MSSAISSASNVQPAPPPAGQKRRAPAPAERGADADVSGDGVGRRVGAPARTLLNDATGKVTLYPNFLTAAESDLLFACLAAREFRRDFVTVFGKRFECPRLVAAFGEPGRVYEFSGTRNEVGADGWAWPLMETIVNRIETLTGRRPNFAHANLYRNGRDYIGWHADDEKTHADGSAIVSLSVGATRKFYLKRKAAGAKTEHRITLDSGSLLVMGGALQQHWKHTVPKELRVERARYNLTFRVMK